MVEMRMRQDHGVDVGGVDRKWRPVPRTDFAAALKEPAVDEYSLSADFHKCFRTGDGGNTADEREEHGFVVSPDPGGQQSGIP